MNIFLHELKTYRKSALTWGIALSLGIIVFFSMYTAFTKDVEASMKVMENLPPAIRAALGIQLSSFFTIYGFFSYLLTFLTLAGAIQAMNIGVGVISKEISGKTADFLLTKPISRTRVITSKLLAAVSTLLITNFIFIAVALVTARVVSTESFSTKIFVLISITFFLIQLMFLALGSVFSVIIPKIKSVIAISLPVVFTFFIIGTLGEVVGNENVRYITPFKFYDPLYIINHGSYEAKFLLIEFAFIVVAITASFIIYVKKDIPAAN